MKKALNVFQNFVLLLVVFGTIYYVLTSNHPTTNERVSENLLYELNGNGNTSNCQSSLQKFVYVETNASISLGLNFYIVFVSIVGFILFRIIRNQFENNRIEINKDKELEPENFLYESASKPGDEFLVAAVLRGMREGRRDAIKPDMSNLEEHMKRSFTVLRATPESVMDAVTNFAGDGKTLSDNYAFLPYDIHPIDGEDEWTEKSIKDYVNEMKRKGFGYYGHINQNGWPLIILAKKRSSLNTLDMSKKLDANDFWNDYYANYQKD